MPFQFELNEVSPLTTHSNYSIKTVLRDNSIKTFVLERCGIVTRGLSRLTVRPVVKHCALPILDHSTTGVARVLRDCEGML